MVMAVRPFGVEIEGYTDTNIRYNTIHLNSGTFYADSDGSLDDDDFETRCDDCDGCGRVDEECGNCDGSGTVTLYDDDDNEYHCDCKTCDGEGTRTEHAECDSCNGRGTINQNMYECEVKSSGPMQNLDAIYEVYDYLDDRGWKTGDNAGLHIHVDAEQFGAKTYHKLVLFMTAVERIIYSITDSGRYRNIYCKPMTEDAHTVKRIVNAEPESIRYIHETKYADGRYYGLNLSSNHPTIEFRYFAPQTQAQNVVNYVELVTRLVNFVRHASYENVAVITAKLYECNFYEAAETLQEVLDLPFNLASMKKNDIYNSYNVDRIKYEIQTEMNLETESA